MKGLILTVLVLFIFSSSIWSGALGRNISKSKKKVPLKKKNVKIVHGDEVTPHSLPYMAAIHSTIDEKSVLCGGSLIATTLVMTSAKCISGASEVEIILGAHNIDESESSQVLLTSSEFIIHPKYKNDSNLHDIALIQLPSVVTLNKYIATIPIPKLENLTTNYDDTLGMVAGWGKTSDTDPSPSSVLHAINVTVIPIFACELSYLFSLTLDQMCTTGVEKKNICLGDSGGPLVVDGVQVGIASYGSNFGCEVGFPGVYTKLASYLGWLYISIDTYAEKTT